LIMGGGDLGPLGLLRHGKKNSKHTRPLSFQTSLNSSLINH